MYVCEGNDYTLSYTIVVKNFERLRVFWMHIVAHRITPFRL